MVVLEPASHLSPEAQAYLRDPLPPIPSMNWLDPAEIQQLRDATIEETVAEVAAVPGAWVSRDEEWGGVPCVRYAETAASLDGPEVLVHLHGGCYLIGTPRTNAAVVIPVTQRTGLPVISIDYRLAPEHPFPAAVTDTVAVVEELASSCNIQAMYGESAGGGLAIAAAVALRDRGSGLPARLGVMSPWSDLTCSGDSYRTLVHADPTFDDPAIPPALAHAYAREHVADPLASPLFADLRGLPPTMIQVGGREILLSDSCRLDEALRRAGVDSLLEVWDGLWHVWQLDARLPEAIDAIDRLAAFLASS